MSFRVLAGTVARGYIDDPFAHVPDQSTNEVQIGPTARVWVWQRGSDVFASTTQPDAATLAKAHVFDAPEAKVFINELGRHVTVEFTGTLPQPSKHAGTRSAKWWGSLASLQYWSASSTAAIPAASWLIVPMTSNVRDSDLDQPFQASLRPSVATDPKITFLTSLCGLDNFLVIRTSGNLGPHSKVLRVLVFKRIVCHYREMARSPARNGNYSLANVLRDNVLHMARDYFQSRFGIQLDGLDASDLTSSAARPVPYKQRVFGDGTSGMRHLLIPQAQRAISTTPKRDLWIGAVGLVGPAADPLAGEQSKNCVVVGLEQPLHANKSDLSIYQDWHGQDVRSAHVKAALAQLGDREQQFFRSLAQGFLGDPEHLVRQQVFETLVHEIAHAFGLIPDSESAGGFAQSNWRDPGGHGPHCSSQDCVMWWMNEQATGSMRTMIRGKPLFDGFRPDQDDPPESRCALYLRSCDLTDLRTL